MRQVILAAFLAAMCGVACAEGDTNLYYKVFTRPRGLDERLITPEVYSQPHTEFKDSVSSIQTQLIVESGETVLLGGGQAADDDWVQYHFLKAWLVWPKNPK